MKLENFKERNLQRNRIIIGVLVGISCVGIAYILHRTFAALHVESDSYVVLEGTISGIKQADVANLKVYVNDGYVENIPEKGSGYVFSQTKSHCAQNIDALAWDYANWQLYENKTANNCEFYFVSPTSDKLITGQNTATLQEIKNAIKSKQINYQAKAIEDQGLVIVPDDFGNSYVYRGKVENNYFLFGDEYYRIVRINGDGSIRLIYEAKDLENKEYPINAYNLDSDNPAYVGYMYGDMLGASYETDMANTVSSNIKDVLEKWYEENIISKKLDKYIVDEIYCNNRSLLDADGYTKDPIDYKSLSWLKDNNANLICERPEDKFAQTKIVGNEKNKYPVGLITADEVAIAGGVLKEANPDYYLANGQDYWTMSSANYTKETKAANYIVSKDGQIKSSNVSTKLAIRPVINLASNINIVGEGTLENPYQIEQ